MRGKLLLRPAIILLALLGSILAWSSHYPPLDLGAWQREQQARAEELTQPIQPSERQGPIPDTPVATPIPVDSITPTDTDTPMPTAVDTPVDTPTPQSTDTDTPILTDTETPPEQTPTTTGSPTPTPPQPTPPSPPGTIDIGTVDTAGGEVASADGRVALDFPPAAVTELLEIHITHEDVTAYAGMPDHPLITAWQFEAFATNRGMAVVDSFPSNVRIKVNYTYNDLDGLNPDTMALWTWDESTQAWTALPSVHVPQTNSAYVDVNHFSVYGGTADAAVLAPPFLQAFQTDLNSGASQVTLPIDVPAGRGGLTPKLTLSYNSNLVNEMKDPLSQGSWTGVGWDLQVGSIYKAHGEGSNPRYFLNLDGVSNELLLGSDGVWRTKHDDYLRIQQVSLPGYSGCDPVNAGTGNANPTPPCYWVITDKSGTTYSFGTNSNSARFYDYCYKPPDPSHYELFYYRWDLQSIVDTHNNAILYEYDQQPLQDNLSGPGQPCPLLQQTQPWVFSSYPKDIQYDFTSDFGHLAEIDFTVPATNGSLDDNTTVGYPDMWLRQDSPRNVDCRTEQFPNGFHADSLKAEETRYLDNIQIKKDSGTGTRVLRKEYTFDYFFTGFSATCPPASGTISLNSLQVLGFQSGELNEMTFQYAVTPPSPCASTTDHFALRDSSGSIVYDSLLQHLQEFSRPFFLSQATNGFGGTATYCYKEQLPSISSGQQHWSRVVASKQSLDGGVADGGDPIVTQYDYGSSGPNYYVQGNDYQNEEFRGFGYAKETRGSSSQPYTEHRFFTINGDGSDDLRSGREYETLAWGSDPAVTGSTVQLWRQTEDTWSVRTPGGCNSNCGGFVHVDAVDGFVGPMSAKCVVDAFHVPSESCGGPHTLTTYEYDAGGDLTVEHDYGLYYGPTIFQGDEKSVWRQYNMPADPDHPVSGDNWLFLPQFQKMYAASSPTGTPAAEIDYFYDGHAGTNHAPDTKGDLTGVQQGSGGDFGAVNVFYVYDTWGNRVSESVPLGTDYKITSRNANTGTAAIPNNTAYTKYEYDTNSPPNQDTVDSTHQAIYLLATKHMSSSNTIILQTSSTWNKLLDVPLTETSVSGNVTNFLSDQYGRVTKVWDNFMSFDQPTTQYIYAWSGGQTGGIAGINETLVYNRFATGTGADNSFTWEAHCADGFGREVQLRRSYTASMTSVVQTAYDDRGNIKYASQPFENNVALACDSPTASGSINKTQYSYNPLGEVAKTTNPDLSFRTAARSGLTLTLTDEDLHRTDDVNDAYGRLAKVIEHSGHGPSDNDYPAQTETDYQHDALDDLTRVTVFDAPILAANPTNAIPLSDARMFYDSLGRKVAMADPDMGYWQYSYDDNGRSFGAGNLTDQTEARKGDKLTMEYDSLNRMTQKCDGQSGSCIGIGHKTNYTYDIYDDTSFCAAGAAALGQLTKVAVQSGATTRYCHDVRGNVTGEQHTIDGTAYTVRRGYNVANQQTQIIYPDGEDVRHAYNAPGAQNGQPTSLCDFATPDCSGVKYVTNATYDVAFRPNLLLLGSGKTTDYDYDLTTGRTTRIRTYTTTTSGYVQDIQYQNYDGAGNVRQVTDNMATPSAEILSFAYDERNRLTSVGNVQNGYIASYAYDDLGNATHIQEGTAQGSTGWYLSYDLAKPHAVLLADNSSTKTGNTLVRAYDYDENGNVSGIAEGGGANDPQSPAAVDSDRDGCSNYSERPSGTPPPLTPTPTPSCNHPGWTLDPTNPWDRFNPEKINTPCKQTVADILAVVGRYGAKDHSDSAPDALYNANRYSDPRGGVPTTGYHPSFDRNGPFPTFDPRYKSLSSLYLDTYSSSAGGITVADILSAVKEYNKNLCPGSRVAPTITTQFTYDNQNRLSEAVYGGTDTIYTYDGEGNLVKQQVLNTATNVTTTTYYVDDLYEVTGTTVTKYYMFAGRRVARNKAGILRYLLADQLGSTTTVTDSSGNNPLTQKYYPFGVTRSGGVGIYTDKQFTGQQIEPNLNTPSESLYFMKSRFYDPITGRFLQADSIVPNPSNPQSLNRYSYANNNPMRYSDPTGHCATVEDCYSEAVLWSAALGGRPLPGQTTLDESMREIQAVNCGHAPDPFRCQDRKNAYEFELSAAMYGLPGEGCASIGCLIDASPIGVACVLFTGNTCTGKDLPKSSRILAALTAGGGIFFGMRGALAPEDAMVAGADEGIIWGPLKPVITDPGLQGIADQIYRPGAQIGHGGTADAIRADLGHVTKGAERIINLERWIAAHPSASASDMHAAQSMIQDLTSAMAGEGYPGP